MFTTLSNDGNRPLLETELISGNQQKNVLILGGSNAEMNAVLKKEKLAVRTNGCPSELFKNIDLREIADTRWDTIVLSEGGSVSRIPQIVKNQTPIPDIVAFGRPADCTVLVSPPKTGTNLLHRAVSALHYRVIGDGANETYELVYRTLEKEKQTYRNNNLPFNFLVSNLGGKGIALSTHGMRLEPDTTPVELGSELGIREGVPFNTAGALWDWINTGNPPIIFNYRDPRDVLVSLVHYLQKAPSPNYWYAATAQILKSLSSLQDQLSYIIRCVPRFFDISFRDHYWLLNHPNVCKVSFEELVGNSGGGSSAKQIWAVVQIMEHLGACGNPEKIASSLFSHNARTFRHGQIGEWKNSFSDRNIKDFNARYDDILENYGYETK